MTGTLLRLPARRALHGAAAGLLLLACAACSREAPAAPDPDPAPADIGAAFDALGEPVAADAATGAIDVATLDPCTLVTQEEAERIVRIALDQPRSHNLGTERPVCTYPGFAAGPVAKVDVLLGDAAQMLLATDRRLNERTPEVFVPIEDLGDEAYRRRSNVYFRKGDVWIVVAAVRLIEESLLHEPLVDAARAAAERLDQGTGSAQGAGPVLVD